ncbi:MAG TPA: guanylate kinase [Sedimentisphaerales bacterium]|nr:guanylate kinase [Sedimentisphaerales bacterium]
MSIKHDGKIIIVSGPSGVGKSTICKEVVRKLDNVFLSVSATTRPKSGIEVDGRDYWFLTREEFEKRIRAGMFFEYAEVFGNLYGTPKDKVDEAIKEGKDVILEIDVQGARKVKNMYPDAKMIFILAPTQKDIAKRLYGRARDEKKVVEERLNGASSEIAAAWQYYEHMVINDDLQQAVNEVIQIIEGNVGE